MMSEMGMCIGALRGLEATVHTLTSTSCKVSTQLVEPFQHATLTDVINADQTRDGPGCSSLLPTNLDQHTLQLDQNIIAPFPLVAYSDVGDSA